MEHSVGVKGHTPHNAAGDWRTWAQQDHGHGGYPGDSWTTWLKGHGQPTPGQYGPPGFQQGRPSKASAAFGRPSQSHANYGGHQQHSYGHGFGMPQITTSVSSSKSPAQSSSSRKQGSQLSAHQSSIQMTASASASAASMSAMSASAFANATRPAGLGGNGCAQLNGDCPTPTDAPGSWAATATAQCKKPRGPSKNSMWDSSFPNSDFINSFVTAGDRMINNLDHHQQNGDGLYGLLPSRLFESCLDCNSIPWLEKSARGTDPYHDQPNTGVVRAYDLTISRQNLAPDGVETPMVLINGQFPGPTLEANWGDTFQITVHNQLTGPEEGTSLHWHGLLQSNTEWWDGVPSISMCPIAPGSSFTYTFQAHLFGTTWYHSHYSAQYAGGAAGPMVIHGPTDNYPTDLPVSRDLGPIMLTDHYHTDYFDLVETVVGAGTSRTPFVTSDNTLIQGKGNTDCSQSTSPNCMTDAGTAKFEFRARKVHRLRFINTSAQALMFVTIDNHKMTVVQLDFVPVDPYEVEQIQLYNGQRVDVLVLADQEPGAYWLRAYQTCAPSNQPYALGAIYYDGCDTDVMPQTSAYPSFDRYNTDCASDPLESMVPAYPMPISEPDTTLIIDIRQETNSTDHTYYIMNGKSYRGNYNHPLLDLVYNGKTSSPDVPQANIIDFGSNETMRIVFNNYTPFPHPMHVHGQNIYVLDFGPGKSDGTGKVVRPENPLRRDVQTLQANGYLVTQLVADNPGIWPFHCHIAWHVSQGLYVNLLQKPEQIQKYDQIPQVLNRTCDPWDAWSKRNVVDQIDSGLRRRDGNAVYNATGHVERRFSPF